MTAVVEKAFDARDVLAVALGLVLEPRRLPAIYRLLGYMTGSEVRTADFGSALAECREFLLQAYPALRDCRPPQAAPELLLRWLDEQSRRVGGVLRVTPN